MIPQNIAEMVSLHRQTSFNPIEGLEPEALARQLSAFRAGTLRDLALTMDAIEERDDVIAGLAPKAKAAVARHGYEISVVEKIPPGMETLAQQQKEALEHFWNGIRVTSAMEPDELGEFSLLVRQMMDAKGKKYSVHHIVWKHDNGRYTAEFIHVPLWFFENRTGPLRFITTPNGYHGEALQPGAWLVTVGLGIMRACAVAWMFKRMSLQDWVSYCEKHGFPGILGKTDAAKDSPEWNDFVDAVAAFSKDWAAVVNRAADLTLIEAKGSGALPYPPLVDRMDRALSALWRGADLSTMSAGAGSGQGASLQGGESDIIEQDDAAWISETMRLKIERTLLDYTFGPGTPALAYIKVRTPAKDTTELDLKIDGWLVSVGHPVSQKQAAERYDRPIPPAGEPLLRVAMAPSPFGAPTPAINESRAARATLFRAEALRQISAAQRKALRPLFDRVLAVADLPDSTFEAGLTQLKKELPDLAKKILASDANGDLAKVWESILGPALISGAAQAAEFQQKAK